jgi:hypothetical protein
MYTRLFTLRIKPRNKKFRNVYQALPGARRFTVFRTPEDKKARWRQSFHRQSNRTRSQESSQTDCTSTYSKMGATLFCCKRICKCTHQSSDFATNQSLHPRFPSPSFQNEQESPLDRRRRSRTLWNRVDIFQYLKTPSNQTHHYWLSHQAYQIRLHSQTTKTRYQELQTPNKNNQSTLIQRLSYAIA